MPSRVKKHEARIKAAKILAAIGKGSFNADQIAERNELCNRLGIFGDIGDPQYPLLPIVSLIDLPRRDIELWAMIGLKLAQSQPEFRKKRGAGRKSLDEDGSPGVDYERTKYLRQCRRRGLAEGVSSSKLTNEALVDAAIRDRHPLFAHSERQSLVQSVARGNSLWGELERQGLIQRASWNRVAIKEMRTRADWVKRANNALRRLAEIGPERPLGLLSFADEFAKERRELFWLLDHPPYRSF